MNDAIDIKREAAVLLGRCRTACLATVDAQGDPHAANVQFAFDDQLHLYFVSDPDSAHGRHIAQHPGVALTVYHHDDAEPGTIRGLQLHAHARPLTDGVDRAKALTLYTARFPFLATNPALLAAVEVQCFYGCVPAWVRLIDNRRGFGWKGEISL